MTRKRFTDTDKWDDEWFMELSSPAKLLWFYLCDSCDHAGIWKVNRKLAEFKIKMTIPWEDCLDQFGGRILMIDSEHWHIRKFVEFQYGPIPNDLNKAHKGVLRLLSLYSLPWCFKGPLKGLVRGYEGAKEKETDKEQETEKDSNADLPIIGPTASEHDGVCDPYPAGDKRVYPKDRTAKVGLVEWIVHHPRCALGKDRDLWQGLFDYAGHEAMSHAYQRFPGEGKIWFSAMSDYIHANYEEDKSENQAQG